MRLECRKSTDRTAQDQTTQLAACFCRGYVFLLYWPLTSLLLHFVSAEGHVCLKNSHRPKLLCYANNNFIFLVYIWWDVSWLGKLAAFEWEYIHLLLPAVTHYHMKASAIDWALLFWVDLIGLCTLSLQSNTVMYNFTASADKSKLEERRGGIMLLNNPKHPRPACTIACIPFIFPTI